MRQIHPNIAEITSISEHEFKRMDAKAKVKLCVLVTCVYFSVDDADLTPLYAWLANTWAANDSLFYYTGRTFAQCQQTGLLSDDMLGGSVTDFSSIKDFSMLLWPLVINVYRAHPDRLLTDEVQLAMGLIVRNGLDNIDEDSNSVIRKLLQLMSLPSICENLNSHIFPPIVYSTWQSFFRNQIYGMQRLSTYLDIASDLSLNDQRLPRKMLQIIGCNDAAIIATVMSDGSECANNVESWLMLASFSDEKLLEIAQYLIGQKTSINDQCVSMLALLQTVDIPQNRWPDVMTQTWRQYFCHSDQGLRRVFEISHHYLALHAQHDARHLMKHLAWLGVPGDMRQLLTSNIFEQPLRQQKSLLRYLYMPNSVEKIHMIRFLLQSWLSRINHAGATHDRRYDQASIFYATIVAVMRIHPQALPNGIFDTALAPLQIQHILDYFSQTAAEPDHLAHLLMMLWQVNFDFHQNTQGYVLVSHEHLKQQMRSIFHNTSFVALMCDATLMTQVVRLLQQRLLRRVPTFIQLLQDQQFDYVASQSKNFVKLLLKTMLVIADIPAMSDAAFSQRMQTAWHGYLNSIACTFDVGLAASSDPLCSVKKATINWQLANFNHRLEQIDQQFKPPVQPENHATLVACLRPLSIFVQAYADFIPLVKKHQYEAALLARLFLITDVKRLDTPANQLCLMILTNIIQKSHQYSFKLTARQHVILSNVSGMSVVIKPTGIYWQRADVLQKVLPLSNTLMTVLLPSMLYRARLVVSKTLRQMTKFSFQLDQGSISLHTQHGLQLWHNVAPVSLRHCRVLDQIAFGVLRVQRTPLTSLVGRIMGFITHTLMIDRHGEAQESRNDAYTSIILFRLLHAQLKIPITKQQRRSSVASALLKENSSPNIQRVKANKRSVNNTMKTDGCPRLCKKRKLFHTIR